MTSKPDGGGIEPDTYITKEGLVIEKRTWISKDGKSGGSYSKVVGRVFNSEMKEPTQ